MAIERARPLPARPAAGLTERLLGPFADWEDWLTLGLALGAVLGVSVSLEDSGWSTDMPPLSMVALVALMAALIIARSPLPGLLGWPLGILMGVAVTGWQTLVMVGPGTLEQRADAVYFRFETWFRLAFNGGVSNDSLPFNVLILGLTWLGVFLFGWSVYRWHNAWLGLIPGGVALFMNLVFIDDTLPGAVFLYVMCGFLLVARTNLMANIGRWRRDGVDYPPLISLTFLHYTTWAGLAMMAAAWLSPVGPFATPGVVESLSARFEGLGIDFVRLAGPLRANKLVPVHDYTAVLPFQGSLNLSDRELLSVEVGDPFLDGPFVLRGAVYDVYASGGWKAGARREVEMPASLVGASELGDQGQQGRIVPLTVTVESKSVVGSVLFTPGQPLSTREPARVRLSEASVRELQGGRGHIWLPQDSGASLDDEEVLDLVPPEWRGLYVIRDDERRVTSVGVVRQGQSPDVAVLAPEHRLREGDTYSVLGVVSDAGEEELRRASSAYPRWVNETYLDLPEMPARVAELAWQVAAGEPSQYDRAKAIETFLRGYPVDYNAPGAPPGRDTVDHFLFESKRGYFDYHASAMVVMLRTLGVPARLAVGFVVDQEDRDPKSTSYIVEHRDAYAWVEVYFPSYGWVEFNPSPDRPADLRAHEKSGDFEIPPVDLSNIRDLPVSTGGFFPEALGDETASGGATTGGSGAPDVPWTALAVVALVAAVIGGAALGWRRSVAGLPYAQQMWEKTVRLASWAGCPPRPGETPSTFARALRRRLRDVHDVQLLADAYNRSRFGGRDVDGGERELLARVWAGLRLRLAFGVVSRLWRRG